MYETPVTPLNVLVEAAEQLLNRTRTSKPCYTVIQAVYDEATVLRVNLMKSHNRAPTCLSVDEGQICRRHLELIVQNAEMLLDDMDDELSLQQRDLVHVIRSGSKQLLVYLSGVLQSDLD